MIATAGSCFAQHISRHLRGNGYNVLDVEPAPAWLPTPEHGRYGYSTYSARFGNIYTLQQLVQLAREAAGRIEPADICWRKGGRYFDALRPAVEPDGHGSVEELRLSRRHHLERVRVMFETMDVFIFTLGLTEAFVHKTSGTVYPTAPGVYAGTFDDSYAFVNFQAADLQRAFRELLIVLKAIRGRRAFPRFLLTVSPVPLTATARKAPFRSAGGDCSI